jgi:tetratricopeptide (TPR) repeat protein
MFCNHCGTSNPDNAASCVVCGEQLEKGTSPPPIMPIGEVQMNVGTQSPAAEYIPTGYEMPPASFPISQEYPTIHDVAQAGNSMPQSYPPPTYPPRDQYQAAEMFGASQPAYADQSSSAFENDQTLPRIPPLLLQPDQPPHDHPEAPTTPLPLVREPWYRALPKPMPLWAFIGSIVAVVLLFVVLQLTGSDWAAGAMHVGIVAAILALVVALAAVVRILLGMAAKSNPKRVIQLVSAGLAILLLLLLCLVGLTQQSTIHSLQAHAWEGQQQWQSSINEYQLAGEGVPTSENIARVYNEWGEQINVQHRYENALAKFNTVLTKYGSASTGVARGQSDTIKAYFAWSQQASQQQDYRAATSHYDALLQLSYCTATCQSQASSLDATNYYSLAESQLATKNYADAVNFFQIVVTRFPSLPEAQKMHQDYAKALFGHGQQQLKSATCSDAVPTYQQLSTQFKDTSEGQQATRALKAPQEVKGHFTGSIPKSPSLTPVVALMKGLYTGLSGDQLANLFYNSPQTTIATDGSFVFGPQTQGSYELAWGTTVNATGAGILYWNTARYIANVGPLCPYDFGAIAENVLAAQ